MQNPQDPVTSPPAAASNAQAAQAAPRGWQVKFLVPPPHTMPTQRLRARAELVRSALSTASCATY
jgi:hypothetical protein